MNKELLEKEKKILPIHSEIQHHHASILDHHFSSIELIKNDQESTILTAFPTPNDFYKENIYSNIKEQSEKKYLKMNTKKHF